MLSLRNGSKRKELKDIDPRKADRAIRVCLTVSVIMIRDVMSNMHV